MRWALLLLITFADGSQHREYFSFPTLAACRSDRGALVAPETWQGNDPSKSPESQSVQKVEILRDCDLINGQGSPQ
jgi:hypothetical protein